MGFNLFELSSWLGRRVCLYEFRWGMTYYRYTSADRKITFGNDPITGDPLEWLPIAIKDNGFTQGMSMQDFEVEIPRSIPLALLFVGTPPAESIYLTCWRFHKDDPDQEAAVYWDGTIGNIRGIDSVKAKAIGIPITNTLRRTGLRLCWTLGCTHSVYDEGCRVDKELFKIEAEIVNLTGVTFTVDELGAWDGALYAGGFIEWEVNEDGTMDRRAIESYVGETTFSVLGSTDRLEVGQTIAMYLGCDLTAERCDTVFDNMPNHGGHEYLTRRSPFDGDPVF